MRLIGTGAAAGVALWLIAGLAAVAEEPPAKNGADAVAAASAVFDTETRHTLSVGGTPLEYVARTGRLTVSAGDESGDKGRMFYVAYARAGREGGEDAARRPITFVFNGGPGAAAAYLHMGLMGPKRVRFSDDGRVAGISRIVDNGESWLAFTDLVFVDPIGTGYSRAVPSGDKGGRGSGPRGSGGDKSPFWATGRDLASLGDFIRLYLTRNERWLSPVVLAGESYGGFRVAALGDRLQARIGLSVAGLVMISPALEMDLLADDRFRLMPWIARVPSFAAAARRHDRASEGEGDDAGALHAVERFAIAELLPALARGASLDGAARAPLARLAELTGLPAALVARYGGKIPGDVFAARLLEDEGRIVSLYDASIAYPAPHPAEARYRDPRLARISAAVATALNHDIRTRLGVKADLHYEVLNREVSGRWSWGEGRGRQGRPGAAENLENAIRTVPGLRALLAHGVYDLVTPYFTSAWLVDQFDLEPGLRRRLTLRTYAGGHMFYSHAAARQAFYDDARRLYAAIAGDRP